jgi:hypothetical protein
MPRKPLSQEEQRELVRVIRERRQKEAPQRPEPGWLQRFWQRLRQ